MSLAYGPLAAWYDKLTLDVPYEEFLSFYEREFKDAGGEFHTILDLCCGTGTLTWLMAEHGYEMIAADASADMLMEASGKAAEVSVPPLFLCQEAAEIDLYGTVDACVCSLDGMDYIPPEELGEVFRRLHLFIRPMGFLFSISAAPSGLKASTVRYSSTKPRTCCAFGVPILRTAACATAWTFSRSEADCGSVRARSISNTPTSRRCLKNCLMSMGLSTSR